MMIVSAKISKRKFLTGLLIAVGVIALLIFLCSKADASGGTMPEEDPAVTNTAADNEARLAFLRSFGWEVADAPVETQEVRIPEEFNEVFTRYNELQKSQGYDLEPYAGKAVKRYVYRVDNHPGGEDYFATLLICKNQIIGGDITGTGSGGTIHGFRIP